MATVPQPYVYPIANIPGGQFGGAQSDRLVFLIGTQLPTAQNPVVSSDGINVIITFAVDLTTEEKIILDNLVRHCADFFIITTDGSTDLGDPATISQDAGLLSSTTLILRLKLGDGTNDPSFNESLSLSAPIMTIDKIEGSFSNGTFSFTVGAVLDRGQAEITITADSMPTKTLIARWK